MEKLFAKIIVAIQEKFVTKAQNDNIEQDHQLEINHFNNSFRNLYLDEDRGVKSIFKNNSLESHILKDWERIMNKYNLKKYDPNCCFEEQNDFFISVVGLDAKILEQKLYRLIYYKFLDFEIIKYFFSALEIKDPESLFELAMNMNIKLYEMLKEYTIGLIEFYYEYPGLQAPIIFTPRDYRFNPFFNYYKNYTNILTYSKDINRIQYLGIIDDRVTDRNFELTEKLREQIINALTSVIKIENGDISELASNIRFKLYKYVGFKCPEHLIFVSLIKDKQRELLVDFIINRYFLEGTSKHALSELFRGNNGIIEEDDKLLAFYKNSNSVTGPIIIKYKNLGYVSFIFDFLARKNLIINDHLWKSIARHRCFKIQRKGNKADFLKNTDISSSFRYKNQRNLGRTKTEDKELIILIEFLKNLFPEDSIS